MIYRHLFWDFDGTLYNSYPQIVRALRRTHETTGKPIPPDEVLLKRIKSSGYYAFCCAAEETGVDFQVFKQRYDAFHQEETEFPPYEGMVECIRALSRLGIRHYLYTHRDKKALWHLERDGLSALFADAVTSEDQFPMKPAPDALLAMMKHNQLDPRECLMIGDRDIDISSGINAGIDSLLFDPGGFYPQTDAIKTVRSMEEIKTLFGAC